MCVYSGFNGIARHANLVKLGVLKLFALESKGCIGGKKIQCLWLHIGSLGSDVEAFLQSRIKNKIIFLFMAFLQKGMLETYFIRCWNW